MELSRLIRPERQSEGYLDVQSTCSHQKPESSIYFPMDPFLNKLKEKKNKLKAKGKSTIGSMFPDRSTEPSPRAQTPASTRANSPLPPTAPHSENASDISNVTKSSVEPTLPKDRSDVRAQGWELFKVALDVLAGASAAFPPLQAAVGGFVEVIKIFDVRLDFYFYGRMVEIYSIATQKASQNEKEFETMAKRIQVISNAIEKYNNPDIPQDVCDRLDALSEYVPVPSTLIGRLLIVVIFIDASISTLYSSKIDWDKTRTR